MKCRICSCTDEDGCPGGCEWIEADLCSVCAIFLADISDYLRACREVTHETITRALDEVVTFIQAIQSAAPELPEQPHSEIWLP